MAITDSKENSNNIYIGDQECWNEFANECKTDQYPQGNDQLHSLDKIHLHFYEHKYH